MPMGGSANPVLTTQPGVSNTWARLIPAKAQSDNGGAYTIVLFQRIPCALQINIPLSRKFGGNRVTRREASFAVRIGFSRKYSLQIPADSAVHICRPLVCRFNATVAVQKTPAISIVVIRRPRSECSRLKSSRNVNRVACIPPGVISERSALGAWATFLGVCRFFSESAEKG